MNLAFTRYINTALHPLVWRCVLHLKGERDDPDSLELLLSYAPAFGKHFLSFLLKFTSIFLWPVNQPFTCKRDIQHYAHPSYFQYHRIRTLAVDQWIAKRSFQEKLVFLGCGLDTRPKKLQGFFSEIICIDKVDRKSATGIATTIINLTENLNIDQRPLPQQATWIIEGVSPYVGTQPILEILRKSKCKGGWVDLYSKSFLKPLEKTWGSRLIAGFETAEDLHRSSTEFAELGVQVVAFGDA